MASLSVLLGAVLIGVGIHDVFHTLFHPQRMGSLSGVLSWVTWRVVRHLASYHPPAVALAGSGALLTVLTTWGTLLVVGWALIFWPFLPEQFRFADDLDLARHGRFVDALYLSLVNFATLGYGDIVPTSNWLRILSALEAIVGFGFLSASAALVLSIYPALGRRRSLAHEIVLLREAEIQARVQIVDLPDGSIESMLTNLTSRIVNVHSDLIQFPITYYFVNRDWRVSLPVALPDLLHLAEQGSGPDSPPAVRLQAAMLRRAIDDLAVSVGERFLGLHSAPTDRVLAAYARDHRHASGGIAMNEQS